MAQPKEAGAVLKKLPNQGQQARQQGQARLWLQTAWPSAARREAQRIFLPCICARAAGVRLGTRVLHVALGGALWGEEDVLAVHIGGAPISGLSAAGWDGEQGACGGWPCCLILACGIMSALLPCGMRKHMALEVMRCGPLPCLCTACPSTHSLAVALLVRDAKLAQLLRGLYKGREAKDGWADRPTVATCAAAQVEAAVLVCRCCQRASGWDGAPHSVLGTHAHCECVPSMLCSASVLHSPSPSSVVLVWVRRAV